MPDRKGGVLSKQYFGVCNSENRMSAFFVFSISTL